MLKVIDLAYDAHNYFNSDIDDRISAIATKHTATDISSGMGFGFRDRQFEVEADKVPALLDELQSTFSLEYLESYDPDDD